MKNPTILVLSGFLLLSIAFGGCTNTQTSTDYSGLTQNETKILSIQDEVTAEINKLKDELQKADLNYDQIRFLAAETTSFIKEKVDQLEGLTENIKTNRLVTDTEKLLETAKRLADKVKETASELQVLEREIGQLADDAKAEAEEKINQAKKMLSGYTSRLENMKTKFAELREFLLSSPDSEDAQTEEAATTSEGEATIPTDDETPTSTEDEAPITNNTEPTS